MHVETGGRELFLWSDKSERLRGETSTPKALLASALKSISVLRVHVSGLQVWFCFLECSSFSIDVHNVEHVSQKKDAGNPRNLTFVIWPFRFFSSRPLMVVVIDSVPHLRSLLWWKVTRRVDNQKTKSPGAERAGTDLQHVCVFVAGPLSHRGEIQPCRVMAAALQAVARPVCLSLRLFPSLWPRGPDRSRAR